LGTVLANSAGFTLYALTDDSPSQSRCTGGCAGVWPPLVVQGVPSGGPGIDPSKLSTLTRADGTLQVVYNGHPLYGYASDRAPGDIRGHGAGGVWFALDAGGELVP
jgi:predicted lipoprotein with Yx(FWY)xxD motif